MTILAARRVLPPDLITPANASNPFMKETGPDAEPPPLSSSFDERMGDRLAPGLAPPADRADPLNEGARPRPRAAAVEQLLRRADGRQVGAGARAVLEEHALGLGQPEDRLHGVVDRVDEAR